MSRYSGEYEGDYPAHWWWIDLERALTSGRGQRLLREVEESLRALPKRELIAGEIVRADKTDDDDRVIEGSVCAVGAFALYRLMQQGATREEALDELYDFYGGVADEWTTERLGRKCGLARTVAWELGRVNDDDFVHLKPRQRWRAVLKWVRNQQMKIVPSEES
jgi:hypothetical protein